MNGPSDSSDSLAFAACFLRAVCSLTAILTRLRYCLDYDFLYHIVRGGVKHGRSGFFSLIHSLTFSRFKVSCRH